MDDVLMELEKTELEGPQGLKVLENAVSTKPLSGILSNG